MSFVKACCTLPPVSSDYQPQGTDTLKLDGMTIYETSNKTGNALLICAYDIFGFHPNVKQFADKLASTGEFRVAMPDFFRGNPIKPELLDEPREIFMPKLMAFVQEHGNWEKTVKADLIRVIEHYKNEGVSIFGIYGFCWGGKIGARAVCELAGNIGAAALIHPSMLTEKDAEEALAPVLFIPTKDEPDMTGLCQTVKDKLGEDKAELHLFGDMFHGFCGARGDWTQEDQRKRVDDAIELTHKFFKKHLTH